MENVISLNDVRALRKDCQASSFTRAIEDVLFTAVRRASRESWGARRTVDEVIAILAEGENDGVIDPSVAASLTGNYDHLLRNWLETLTQYNFYLHMMRFHLGTGSQDLIISDGLEEQGDDSYPSPMLYTGFGIDPHNDGKIYSSASLSSRSMWFDGEFQELDKPAVSQHPETEPRDSDSQHLDTPPHIRWRTDVDTARRGMVHPNLLNSLIDEFFLSAVACNMGVTHSIVDDRHRFSYLETIGKSTVIEWTLSLHSKVYDLYGV